MAVMAIWAEVITVRSRAMGEPIFAARLKHRRVGRNDPRFSAIRNSGERRIRYHTMPALTTRNASAEPNAAPVTPKSAPGMVISSPATV